MKLNSGTLSARNCPYEDCPGRKGGLPSGPESGRKVRRKGYYRRSSDSQRVARFKCLQCLRSFSSARFSPCFRQKKRRLNEDIRKLLCSGVSQRSVARLLRTDLKTVARKLDFLATQARLSRQAFLDSLSASGASQTLLQFDEMESFERSKCLPLSIPLAVLPGSRKILGFRVAEMPANGPLAAISRKKYGKRKDERSQAAQSLLSEIASLFDPRTLTITTDQNPRYPEWLKPHFPHASHTAVKGRRGCVVGQGELKKIGFDPLFSLNHTCAMIRAHINRLFRRTWCTTKRRDRLVAHLELYVQYHNEELTAVSKR
jgi:hypothetical protein